jgi:hypothetical protein
MPGFFDKVTKGLTDAAEGVSKAVSDATSSSGTTPGAGGTQGTATTGAAAPPPPNVGYVFSGPSEWITPDELSQVVHAAGVPASFGAPTSYESEESWTARWASPDGSVTVDVTTYKDTMRQRLGSLEAIIDELRPVFSERSWSSSDDDFEIGVFGTRREGHCGFIGAVGDTVITAEVYGPAGPALETAAYRVALRCVEE